MDGHLIGAAHRNAGVLCRRDHCCQQIIALLGDLADVHANPYLVGRNVGDLVFIAPDRHLQRLVDRGLQAVRYTLAGDIRVVHGDSPLGSAVDGHRYHSLGRAVRGGNAGRQLDGIGKGAVQAGHQILHVDLIQRQHIQALQRATLAHQRYALGLDIQIDRFHQLRSHQINAQRHGLGGTDRHRYLNQLCGRTDIIIIHRYVIIIIQRVLQRFDQRTGRAVQIHRYLGVADIQHILPLGPQRQGLRIDGNVAGEVAVCHLTLDLRLDGNLLLVKLAHRHGNIVQAPPLDRYLAAGEIIRVEDIVFQRLYTGGGNVRGVGHNADLGGIQPHHVLAGTLQPKIHGGIIAGQQHQAVLRQNRILIGKFHGDIMHLYRRVRRNIDLHIDPQRQRDEHRHDDLSGFAVFLILLLHHRPPPFPASSETPRPGHAVACPLLPQAASARCAAACRVFPASGAA